MAAHDSWFTPLGRAALSHRRPTNLSHFLFGCDYYPEHWDEALRRQDPPRMRAAGFNVVRMGEFAWDRLEPREGVYDFSLFDETIARLAEHGIATIFGTPTATPPRWLTCSHPEVLRINADGIPMQHGSRQHPCVIHPRYRDYAQGITRVLADHFRDNPNVIGWQTDNELYLHFSECHCPSCQQEFRHYLRRVFDDNIDKLNREMGTAFWGQTYGDFGEIETVKWLRPHTTNPAMLLQYYRFLAFGASRFQHVQVDILRKINPNWFVTHNSPGAHVDLNGAFLRDLDFLALDHYPTFHQDFPTRPANQAFTLDTTRGYGGNFLVMEHQSGQAASRMWALDTPEPGEVRLMTYACLARGADGVLYFRWRSCRFGAEIYWRGILDHDDVPRRIYREIAGIGSEMQAIGREILGTSVRVDVAVAQHDVEVHDAHTAHGLGLPAPDQAAEDVHRYFYERGYAVGCVHPADDLTGLKLYFIPHWALFDPAWTPGLDAWVRQGGTLVIGARTATRNLNNNVVPETIPGCLRALAGVTVEEYGNQIHPDQRPLTLQLDGETIPTSLWYEQLNLEGDTAAFATWTTRHLAGTPAISRRQLGKGNVLYVGTYLTPDLIAALGPKLIELSDLHPLCPVPEGVEVVCRESADKQLWFFLNHTEDPVTIPQAPAGVNLITGQPVNALTLAPREVAVIRSEGGG